MKKWKYILICGMLCFYGNLHADFDKNQCSWKCSWKNKYKKTNITIIDKGFSVLTQDGMFFINNHAICYADENNYYIANNSHIHVRNYRILSEQEIKEEYPNSWDKVNLLWINYIATL